MLIGDVKLKRLYKLNSLNRNVSTKLKFWEREYLGSGVSCWSCFTHRSGVTLWPLRTRASWISVSPWRSLRSNAWQYHQRTNMCCNKFQMISIDVTTSFKITRFVDPNKGVITLTWAGEIFINSIIYLLILTLPKIYTPDQMTFCRYPSVYCLIHITGILWLGFQTEKKQYKSKTERWDH